MPHTTKLVNMKLPPPEPPKPMPENVLSDGPRYPWGLSLRLDNDALEKLSIATLPPVGGELYLTAKVKVTSVREEEYTSEGEGPHSHKCVELQITDMALGPLEEEAADAGAKLYGAKA